MFLRKLVAAVCPLLLCILLSIALRWMDGLSWLSGFWGYAIKGLLLGFALALILPAGGVKSHMNGLQPWFLGGVGLLVALILLQYLAFAGVLRLLLLELLGLNPQMVLIEGTAVGFMLVTVILNRRR